MFDQQQQRIEAAREHRSPVLPPCAELAARRVEIRRGELIYDLRVRRSCGVFRTFQDSGKTFTADLSHSEQHGSHTQRARRTADRTTHWLILVTAGIGFAFDMYEIVVQAIVAAAHADGAGPVPAGDAGLQSLGRHHAVPAHHDRRTGRAAGRLSDRPARTAARAGVEHRALRRCRVHVRACPPRCRSSSSGAASPSPAPAWSSSPPSPG